MKTDSNKSKPSTDKSKAKIETDLPLSEKDEVKRAEEKMRQSTKGAKKS
jgi:hypothetical protein